MMRKRSERGNQTLEFTFIGIPIIYLLFSVANMSFAMLTLHTLQEAVEQGARFVSTRGSGCSAGGNTCTATFQQTIQAVANSAAGISPSKLNITLTSNSGTALSCSPASSCLAGTCPMTCSGVWPTSTNSDNSPGSNITVSANVQNLAAPIFMFWAPGTAVNTKTVSFQASSQQRLMF